MPHWPRAVFFDFDGVIVNSEPLHFLAFHEVLAEQHIELTEAEYYEELLGYDDRGGFKHIFEKHNKPLDAKTLLYVMTRKNRVMMNFIEQRHAKALPGVEEFVRGLWRHYPLAICSGALRDEIDAMLVGISLRDCFEVITAAEDVEKGKPDPSGYLQTMRHVAERTKIKLTPADCLIIEDAPTVVRAVKEVGFRVLAVTTSYPAEKLADADYVVSSLKSAEVLEKIPSLKLTADTD